MQSITKEQQKAAIEFLVDAFSPTAIYLFGSAARNELREDSDIDIAMFGNESHSTLACYDAAQKMVNIFQRDVDLIDLRNASSVFAVQILSEGKAIYCNDINKKMQFEMIAYKAYAMLNEERSVIIDRFVQKVSAGTLGSNISNNQNLP